MLSTTQQPADRLAWHLQVLALAAVCEHIAEHISLPEAGKMAAVNVNCKYIATVAEK